MIAMAASSLDASLGLGARLNKGEPVGAWQVEEGGWWGRCTAKGV